MFGIRKKKEFASSGAEFLIVGLGNPGDKYEFTRHNAGFMCVDFFADKLDFKINKLKYKSLLADVDIKGHRCLVMKPQTFMNNSGEAVRDAAQFYKIPPENVIVIYDDISLDVGKIRVRRKGSDGGHNGIKSIIYHLNSDNFPRIKIGVGAKPEGWQLYDWVLGKFSAEDITEMRKSVENAYEALKLYFTEGIEEAMQKFN